MGQEKVYMGQESLIGWDRRDNLMGQKMLIYIGTRQFFGNKCPFFSWVKTIVIRIVR
jgi:hypothetical protein